jgi:hypothetical protein
VSDDPPRLYDQSIHSAAEDEVLHGVVLNGASARRIEPVRPPGALSPALVQTAAIVGVSVAAGAATVAMVHRRKARRLVRRRRKVLAPVLASRSFLVDVHVLGERGK